MEQVQSGRKIVGEELDLEGVIGLGGRRSYDDERLVEKWNTVSSVMHVLPLARAASWSSRV